MEDTKNHFRIFIMIDESSARSNKLKKSVILREPLRRRPKNPAALRRRPFASLRVTQKLLARFHLGQDAVEQFEQNGFDLFLVGGDAWQKFGFAVEAQSVTHVFKFPGVFDV